MERKLLGKVALVTGASKGIGRGLAEGLAAAGAMVAVNYNTDAAGAELTCANIRAAGGKAESFQADVGRKIAVENLVAAVCQRLGRIDILVNNAARTRFGPTLQATEEDFDDVFDTNVRGPFFGSIAAARQMLQQGGGGSIINISSCVARLSIPFHSAYTASKTALEGMTAQMALEFAPHIRVNAIAPAPTSTERNRGYNKDYDRQWGGIIPAARVAYVSDYVGPCVFLASEDSAFMTGQILSVDGGWSVKGASPDMTKDDFSGDFKKDAT